MTRHAPVSPVLEFIRSLPKAELHLHIEGTLEPEMLLMLAERNQIALPYSTVEEVQKAYQFSDLQSFLDLYYKGMSVLRTYQDFYDLAFAYVEKCSKNGTVHVECIFDPQGHLHRGIPFEVFFTGLRDGCTAAGEKYGITHRWLLGFLRDLSEEDAQKTWELAKPFLNDICGVSLNSAERDNPPQKFARVFAQARAMGLHAVAHAGEEGPASYIWEAINVLRVDRVDHGVRCVQDASLMKYLKIHKIPLTVCPLSNVKLKVFSQLEKHNIGTLLQNGVNVTVNSDDPAYFGHLLDNYVQCYNSHLLSLEDIVSVVKNSISASFLPEDQKAYWLKELAQKSRLASSVSAGQEATLTN